MQEYLEELDDTIESLKHIYTETVKVKADFKEVQIVRVDELQLYANVTPAEHIVYTSILLDAIKAQNQAAFDIALVKVSDAELNHPNLCYGHSVKGNNVTHTVLQQAYIHNFPYAIDALLGRGVEDGPDASIYQGESHICDQIGVGARHADVDEGM